MIKQIWFLSLVFFLGCAPNPKTVLTQHTVLNLDFEFAKNENVIDRWRLGDTGYIGVIDHQERQHGNASLRLERVLTYGSPFSTFYNDFISDSLSGKTVELTGWIKTKDVKESYASLWLRVDGLPGTPPLDYIDLNDRGISGTSDWTYVSIIIKVVPGAKKVRFGGILFGDGAAWFDNFKIYIDGKQHEDSLLDEPKSRLTKRELTALKQYIYPLKSVAPDYKETEDLKVLHQLVKQSSVVALGEVTHGSSHIFKLKDRIIRYLAENKGFNIFSIEANMTESYKLNQYIVEKTGDPKELIQGMHFWIWDTKEMLDMVEWMQSYNKYAKKILFTGVDMQFYDGPIDELHDFFKNSPKILSHVISLKHSLDAIKDKNRKNLDITPKDQVRVESELFELKKYILASTFDRPTKEWLIQNTNLIKQFTAISAPGGYVLRDRYMSDNLLWLKDYNPVSRIVIWAHNAHISKSGGGMGEYLKNALSEDYVTFGFAFFKGNFTAYGNEGLTTYKAEDAYPGTLEYLLDQIEQPIFILDLKKIKAENNKTTQWIKKQLNFRNTGAVQETNDFILTNIIDDFDYLIFIRETSASQLLHEY